MPASERHPSRSAPSRRALITGSFFIAVIVVLVCLFPKPENDLFFELRTGSDILDHGTLPHVDTYSWVNRGTRWDVPEWLSFVLYTLSYRAGGFFGTWLLMVSLTITVIVMVWFWLAPRVGPVLGFILTNLTLLGLSDCIQERPYAFTYVLLPLCLMITLRARDAIPASSAHASGTTGEDDGAATGSQRPSRRLLALLPVIVAIWANLHQGLVVFIALLCLFGLGDLGTALRLRARDRQKSRRYARLAGLMLLTAAACAVTAMASPYGWRLYRNVFITLRDPSLMSNVTEWRPITVLPVIQLQPFIVISAVVLGALALSRRRSPGDMLVVGALFVEALLHARNTALFCLAGTVVAAPHIEAVLEQSHDRLFFASSARVRNAIAGMFALLYAAGIAMVSVANLGSAVGPKGYTPEGIGEAAARVPHYPAEACAFIEAEHFPPGLRIFNNFEIGGYLMMYLPEQPVFSDGRLDVYVGKTFNDTLILTRLPGTPEWADLVRRYDFDCVITTSGREAAAFRKSSDWQLVYEDPRRPHTLRCRVLLRRRPQFAAVIARCLHDRPLAN